jgi:hypothetical protein
MTAPTRDFQMKRHDSKLQALLVCGLLSAVSAQFAVVTPAFARVILRLGLVNTEPVPANGVLKFTYDPRMTVRILAADGSEVLGSFVADGIWRPTEPFEIGTYTADVEYEPAPNLADDRSFEVIAAVDELPELLRVSIVSQVVVADVLEKVCCAAGAAGVSTQPCESDCKPLCVPVTYAVKQTVQVVYYGDWENPLIDQARIQVPTTLSAGQFAEGGWDVTDDLGADAPAELCGVGEVFSWLDETTTTVTHCIPNPKPELTPVRDAVTSFGHITECTEPPDGYRAQWCQAHAYTCEHEVLTLTAAESELVSQACAAYYDLCDREDPTAPDVDTSSADAGSAAADDTEGEGDHADVEQRGVGESSSGCSVQRSPVAARASTQSRCAGFAVLLALAGASVSIRRRRR